MAIRSVGIEWQACHMAAKKAFFLCWIGSWLWAGGLRHTTAFFLLIANKNERLALSSNSHPCSSVLSSLLKESAALPNTSHSSAIPAGILAASPVATPDPRGQTGAAVGVNPRLQQHLALLFFHSHTVPDLQHFQPEEPLLPPEQGLTVSH